MLQHESIEDLLVKQINLVDIEVRMEDVNRIDMETDTMGTATDVGPVRNNQKCKCCHKLLDHLSIRS